MARRSEDAPYKEYLTTRWWLQEKPEDIAGQLASRVDRIRQRHKYRKSMDQFHARLYDGSVGVFAQGLDVDGEYDPAQLPFNVVRNGVDTLIAMVSKNRPLPQVITDGADYKQRKMAERMSKGIEGSLYKAKFWHLRPTILRDAGIFGTGITRQYRIGKRIFIERVLPMEILVDRADGARGQPRAIYFVRTRDRFVLADEAPEAMRQAILDAAPCDHNEHEFVWLDENEDRLLLIDAYRLPDNSEDVEDGGKARGGRHVTMVRGVQEPLVDESWDKPYFPFSFVRKSEPVAGFWGTGIAQEMAGFQLEINTVADKLQSAHHVMGGGHILVQTGSDIIDSDITNGIGHIIKYKGQKPEWHSPTPVNEATYRYLQDLGTFALQYSGISQMSAQSTKPPGISAARALLVLDDIETQRFMVFARSDEEWVMDIGNQIIDLLAEIASEDKDFTINVPGEREMVPIKWKENELERQAYVLQVFPTSLLAKTPSARLQMVQDLFNAKVIDRSMFLKLLNAPDLNAEQDLEAAGRDVADAQIQKMLDATDPEAPDAFEHPEDAQDLVYSMHRAQAQLNMARMRGVKEGNRQLLRDYIAECKRLLDVAMQPPPGVAPPGAPGEVPPGMPPGGAAPVNLPGAITPPTEQMGPSMS